MKTAVYKYPFDLADEFTLELLTPGDVLHVDTQSGVPCMWVLVWPESEATITRRFRVYGTGTEWSQTDNLAHRGTFFEPVGDGVPFVWHIFEVEPWLAIKKSIKEQKP